MKNLLVSGNTTESIEWDIEDILQDRKPIKNAKRQLEDMEWDLRQYQQSRREIYEGFYLNERLR
jgi:hypothetical protein